MASNLTEPQQKSDDQRSARRRLIKGSFAAPAALTLCSGSAIAASSTTCVKTSAENPTRLPANPPATWVRIQAHKNAHDPSGDISEWIRYEQVTPKLGASGAMVTIVAGNGGNLGLNEALCVFPGSGVNGTLNHRAAWPLSNGTSSSMPDGRFYAMLIDTNGDIVGISSGANVSGGLVSNGCWQSFGGMV